MRRVPRRALASREERRVQAVSLIRVLVDDALAYQIVEPPGRKPRNTFLHFVVGEPGGSVHGERANFKRLLLGCIEAD